MPDGGGTGQRDRRCPDVCGRYPGGCRQEPADPFGGLPRGRCVDDGVDLDPVAGRKDQALRADACQRLEAGPQTLSREGQSLPDIERGAMEVGPNDDEMR